MILNFDSNRGGDSLHPGEQPQMIAQKKKVDHPKITPPNADMYKQGNTPNNIEVAKKGFTEKTPFEKEMDIKANEIKRITNNKGTTQEQAKI